MNLDELNRYLNVSHETYEKLDTYVGLILKWQPHLNLISPNTVACIWHRHILDSLQLCSLMDHKQPILDIGSGAGLPAIPLSIAIGVGGTLVESDQRKAIFLAEAARTLSLELIVRNQRIEDANLDACSQIISRACAPLHQLFSWSSPLLSPEGECVFPKGANYRNELKLAQQTWSFDHQAITSWTNPEAAILRITNLAKR